MEVVEVLLGVGALIVGVLTLMVPLGFIRQTAQAAQLAAEANLRAVEEAVESRRMEEEYRRELQDAQDRQILEEEERRQRAEYEAKVERDSVKWNRTTERMSEIARLVIEVREAAQRLVEANGLRQPSQVPPEDGSEWPIRNLSHTYAFDSAQLRLRAALAHVDGLRACRDLANRRDRPPRRPEVGYNDEARPYEVTSAVLLDCIRLSEAALDEVISAIYNRRDSAEQDEFGQAGRYG